MRFDEMQKEREKQVQEVKKRVKEELKDIADKKAKTTSSSTTSKTTSSASSSSITIKFPTSVSYNQSVKKVFDECIYVAYMQDPAPFDDAVKEIGGIADHGCASKYAAKYLNLSTAQRGEMNGKIRAAMNDPMHVVDALKSVLK